MNHPIESEDYTAEEIQLGLQQLNDEVFLIANEITETGIKALAPYKVKNAIIMAAGLSSRFAPISYEKPKGILTVKGEILIERQIRQLHEAGITDIYVVVGYMMEQFFYLEEKFGVTIVVNPNYASRNNNGSLFVVRKFLGNSYICSSDNYFTENVFEKYVYDSYYAATWIDHESTELYIKTDVNNRIISTFHGGKDQWALLGHCYLSKAFAKQYIKYLLDVYYKPETKSIYWEWVFYPHFDEMLIYARKYRNGVIWEFDSIAEIQEFDEEFLDNVDSTIMLNICEVLKCSVHDVYDIRILEKGGTNLLFSFQVNGKNAGKYVYRNSGDSTDK